jgi:hypothetical protein
MIVDELDIMGVVVAPNKADSKLIIDADRVLTRSIVLQSFEAIPEWEAKIIERASAMQHAKPPTCD